MADNTTLIHQTLQDLGLAPEEASIYHTLIQKGPLTALAISKAIDIPRTTTYRLLENMSGQGLIEQITEAKTTRFKASDPARLQTMLKHHQDHLATLTKHVPQVVELLHHTTAPAIHTTTTKTYRGRIGIQQMVENILEVGADLIGYTSYPFAEAVGSEFAEYFYQEMFVRQLHMRDVISESYLTQVPDVPQHIPPQFAAQFETRVIGDHLLTIPIQCHIYRDTVAIYDWRDGEVFGVEITNPKVADFHRQLFEITWQVADPLPTPD